MITPMKTFCGLCGLLLIEGHAAAQEPWFRAPTSGKKVNTYEVELSMDQGQMKTFRVPDQCGDVLASRIHNEGMTHSGNLVGKSFWWKVESDCRYYTFLKRYKSESAEDYVGEYDFKNANLADLPITEQCGNNSLSPFSCPNFYLGTGDIRQILPEVDHDTPEGEFNRQSCTLRDGLFRGWVKFDGESTVCLWNDAAPGLRVMTIDYADVNGDGFMDAVLRMSPLGLRNGRKPAVLPVSRKSADDEFFVPQHDAATLGRRHIWQWPQPMMFFPMAAGFFPLG